MCLMALWICFVMFISNILNADIMVNKVNDQDGFFGTYSNNVVFVISATDNLECNM